MPALLGGSGVYTVLKVVGFNLEKVTFLGGEYAGLLWFSWRGHQMFGQKGLLLCMTSNMVWVIGLIYITETVMKLNETGQW